MASASKHLLALINIIMLGIILGAIDTTEEVGPVDAVPSDDDATDTNDNPAEGDNGQPQQQQDIDLGAHKDFEVQFDGKFCYVAKTVNEAKEKKTEKKDPINGKLIVNALAAGPAFPTCLSEYAKRQSRGQCGTGAYDLYAYCSKVKFFGKFGVHFVRNNKMMERNNPQSPDEQQKHYKQDHVLTIIEGCLRCDNEEIFPEVEIQLHKLNPKGPIAKVCMPNIEVLSGLRKGTLKTDDSSFIINAIFKERFCVSRQFTNSTPELAPLRYAYHFMLVIKHKCNEKEVEKEYKLRTANPIEIGQLTDNVFELRGLEINLNGMPDGQEDLLMWNWRDKRHGVGYQYWVPENNEGPVNQKVESTCTLMVTESNDCVEGFRCVLMLSEAYDCAETFRYGFIVEMSGKVKQDAQQFSIGFISDPNKEFDGSVEKCRDFSENSAISNVNCSIVFSLQTNFTSGTNWSALDFQMVGNENIILSAGGFGTPFESGKPFTLQVESVAFATFVVRVDGRQFGKEIRTNWISNMKISIQGDVEINGEPKLLKDA